MDLRVVLLVVLSATLSYGLRASLSSGDAAHVTVTFTNEQQYPVTFLKWNTPFDELSGGRAFLVNVSGVTIPYSGRVGKRAPPTSEDLLTIGAGESVSTTVDLSEHFNFPKTASYEVQLVPTNLEGAKLAVSFSSLQVKSDVVTMNIPASPVPAPHVESIETTYVDCTADQQTTVNTAWEGFKALAPKAQTEAAKGASSTSYTTYFGAFSATRNTNVVKVTTNEVTSSKGTGYAMNCKPPSCGGSGTYAYVYPGTPTTIYLCAQFWKAPVKGFDSTPGVLVHEISHFTVVGGTQDYIYGNTAAKSLAISNPTQAVANADNYEYFAESL